MPIVVEGDLLTLYEYCQEAKRRWCFEATETKTLIHNGIQGEADGDL